MPGLLLDARPQQPVALQVRHREVAPVGIHQREASDVGPTHDRHVTLGR